MVGKTQLEIKQNTRTGSNKMTVTKRQYHSNSYRSHPALPLHLNFLQLLLPSNDVNLFLISRHGVDAFGFPPGHSLLGLGDLPPCHFVLLAHLTLAGDARRFENQFHATGLARSVFLVAVGSESSPLVVAANKDLLVIETHVYFNVSDGRMVFRGGGK